MINKDGIFLAKTFEQLSTAQLYEILKVRSEIFLLEQDIRCQDMDDVDYDSLHCFYWENNTVPAYLRAYYEDESRQTVMIGRVLTRQHGTGLGKKLMEESLCAIKHQMRCNKIKMHAQKYAKGFYEKLGFYQVSDDFLEEGVVHIMMESCNETK